MILTGWYLPSGGLADVYLDGELSRTVDVYPDEDDVKFGEAVWHAFGLTDAEHELRLVVRGEPYDPGGVARSASRPGKEGWAREARPQAWVSWGGAPTSPSPT